MYVDNNKKWFKPTSTWSYIIYYSFDGIPGSSQLFDCIELARYYRDRYLKKEGIDYAEIYRVTRIYEKID